MQFSPEAGGWVNLTGWNGQPSDLKSLRSGGLVIVGTGRADGEAAIGPGVWLMERGTVRRLGGVPNGNVNRASITNEGEIVVGGSFTAIGNNLVRRVARWDGVEWQGFGEGPVAQVTSLLAESRDSIVVGGGGINGTAQWNGSTWTGLGNFLKQPSDFLCTPEGDLLAVGHLGNGLNNVSLNGDVIRWTGEGWIKTFPGSSVSSNVFPRIIRMQNGRYVTTKGNFGGPPGPIAFDGTTWTELGNFITGSGDVLNLVAMPSNSFGTLTQSGIPFRWQDGVFFEVAKGLSSAAASLAVHPDGSLIAGGSFTSGDGKAIRRVARRIGNEWHPMGDGFNEPVSSVVVAADGTIFAGGSFSASGQTVIRGVARWTGQQWSPVGTGLGGSVHSIAALPSGGLVAVGTLVGPQAESWSGARWDGQQWTALPATGFPSVLQVRTNDAGKIFVSVGDVAAGANPTNSAILTLEGDAWVQLGGTFSHNISSFALGPNDEVLAVGAFTTIGGAAVRAFAQWNGQSWSVVAGTAQIGNGNRVERSPAGGYVFDALSTSSQAVGFYRWNANQLQQLRNPQGSSLVFPRKSEALTIYPNGDVATATATDFSLGLGSPNSRALWFFSNAAAPSIARQPESLTVCNGSDARFDVQLSGVLTPTFRWRRNGQDIDLARKPTANQRVLILPRATRGDEGTYDCVISTPCGNSTSQSVTLTITNTPCSPADIADDAGNPLPPFADCTQTGANSGINEGDYCAFFSANGFFEQASMGVNAVGMFCDIADDQGQPLLPGGRSVNGAANSGVNEGDYNGFFNSFFVPCV
ncbi:MAG: immunoglobulin domain-containing protein [Phycisphaerales bacterium]|nr:immunoglobulin domain-containing protein [Phycisphaerales bacterium]